MKWLKRKMRTWIFEDEAKEDSGIGLITSDRVNRPDTNPIMNFRIYSAENGQVLEFNNYDTVKDRNNVSLYIINKGENVEEKVAKCLSMELLKK